MVKCKVCGFEKTTRWECTYCRSVKGKEKRRQEREVEKNIIANNGGYKTCPSCGVEKKENEDNFGLIPKTGTYYKTCKKCVYAAVKEKERQRKEASKIIKDGKTYRKCTCCGIEKEETTDNYFLRTKTNSFTARCKVCCAIKAKEYREENKDICVERSKKYREKNKDKIAAKKKEKNREKNKEKIKSTPPPMTRQARSKKYYKENKEQIIKKVYIYKKARLAVDPEFRLRKNISNIVNLYITRNGGKKNGKTHSKYMPWTYAELATHLESLFEPWMSWDNYGAYSANTWIDGDESTYKWSIDHIIPQADLPYDSMDHPNFKKCWALENLRPLSAKQNLLDGANRTRHKKAVV